MLIALLSLVQAAPSPQPCSAPEYRQFDFWLGSWEVRPNGADLVIAHSLIERKFGGCAIRENWMPVGKMPDGGGGSLSHYDPTKKQWRQVWLDSSGGRADLDGSFKDGVMTITGPWVGFAGPGKDAIVTMRYQSQPNGEVRQWGEQSLDGGKTWQKSFDFLYRKAPLPSAK